MSAGRTGGGALQGGRPAALLAILALWTGIATAQTWSQNHERGLELHRAQRRLAALQARNEELLLRLSAHLPGEPLPPGATQAGAARNAAGARP